MDNLKIFFVFTCFICFATSKLLIKELRVPDYIEDGSTDEVILDCDYEATNETGIVVKWFYNGDIQQIYQWIPESKTHGYSSGALKNNIDLGFKISEAEDIMYRALRITDLTPEMSGNYTCKVSSDQNEVKETKQLIIFTPADSDLEMYVDEDNKIVNCSASGLSPKPVMKLFIDGQNDTDSIEGDVVLEQDENGFYTIFAHLNYALENLTHPVLFVCDLSIPGTNYSLIEGREIDIDSLPEEIAMNFNYDLNTTEIVYNNTEDNSGRITSPSTTLFTTVMFTVIVTILT